MELYLVRHTETVCKKGICYGQADVALAKPYREIFESIAQQLPSQAKIYYSPLQRCQKLALYLEACLNPIAIQSDSRLMEMNFGDWELQPWEAIPRAAMDVWAADFVNEKVPSGESFADLHNRVIEFLASLPHQDDQSPIILVTHAGVIRSILCYVNNLPLKDAFQNAVSYGQVIHLTNVKLKNTL